MTLASRNRLVRALALLVFAGCTNKPASDDSSAPLTETDSTVPTDSDSAGTPTDPVSACTSGTFGALPDPLAAIHVSADGDDTAAGSWDAPLATLDAAVTLSRTKGAPRAIFVGPGTFEAALNLAHSVEDTTDDGLGIYGCGADETTLEAAGRNDPVVKVSQVAGFTLDGVTLSGGRRALWIWQGATASLSNLVVTGSSRSGIVIDGSDTFTSANEVEVRDTVAEASGGGTDIGYGISVQLGTLEMSGGGVYGSTGVGVLVHFGSLTMDAVAVESTASDSAGYLGRGVQLQELADGSFTDVTLTDNADAGLFALRALVTTLDGVSVTNTAAAGIPATAAAATTGDGIVITQGDTNYDVASFQADINNNLVNGSDRAGVVVDGVTVLTCTGNTVSSNGYPSDGSPQIVVQGGAVMPDPDTADDWTTLDTPIPVNVLSLEVDDLSL